VGNSESACSRISTSTSPTGNLIIVEDVVDTGLTLNYLTRVLALRLPTSIAIATLFDRPYRRLVDDLPVRYVGFTVPDELFAGYGFDLDERFRNLPTSTSQRVRRRIGRPLRWASSDRLGRREVELGRAAIGHSVAVIYRRAARDHLRSGRHSSPCHKRRA